MASSIPTEYLFTKTSWHPQFMTSEYLFTKTSWHPQFQQNIYSPKRHGILNSDLTEYLFTKTSWHPQFQQNIYSLKRHGILNSNRISIHQNVMASSIPTEYLFRKSIHQKYLFTKTSWHPQFQQNIYSPKRHDILNSNRIYIHQNVMKSSIPTEYLFTKTSWHPQFQQNILH